MEQLRKSFFRWISLKMPKNTTVKKFSRPDADDWRIVQGLGRV